MQFRDNSWHSKFKEHFHFKYFQEIFLKYSHRKDFSLFFASVGKKEIYIHGTLSTKVGLKSSFYNYIHNILIGNS